jgi:TonB family protein
MRRTILHVPAFFLGIATCAAIVQETPVGKVSEHILRNAAATVVTPEYPSGAAQRGASGVAVAEVEFDSDGRPVRVEILEAPEPDIARAVERALWNWRLKPGSSVQGQPGHIKGKLTYYFVLQGREPKVLGPEVPGYWGKWKRGKVVP